MAGELRVIATAGHVDHGKSSLIVRLTGIDPDRWAEEKRRGLTIDLGYAWCTLPSGREIGFVDVPGHERFVRNMLAGVGPVRLVLFVVAADEGWKPQSEEHLQILDVLGVAGGVIALTKRDLVDEETLLHRARRGARTGRGHRARGLADRRRVVADRRGRAGPDRGARPDDRGGARPRGREDTAVRGSDLRDQGGGDGHDRDAHRRLPADRRGDRAVSERRASPDPRPPDPQGTGGPRVPRLARRREPRRGRPRSARTRRRPGLAGRVAADDDVRRHDPGDPGARPGHPHPRRLHGARRRRRDRGEGAVPRGTERGALRPDPHREAAGAGRVRSLRAARGRSPDHRRRRRGAGRRAARACGRSPASRVPGPARGRGSHRTAGAPR